MEAFSHDNNLDQSNGKDKSLKGPLVLFAGFVSIVAAVYFGNFSHDQENIDSVLLKTFPSNYKLVSYLSDQLVPTNKNRKVVTLLIGSDNPENTELFLQKFTPLFENFYGYKSAEYEASSITDRRRLFNFASMEVKDNNGRVILVVKNIDDSIVPTKMLLWNRF